MSDRHALREVALAKELAGFLGKVERGDLGIIRLLLHDYRVEILEEQEEPAAAHEDLKKRFDVICLLAGITPGAAMHIQIGGMPKLSAAQRKWAERIASEVES